MKRKREEAAEGGRWGRHDHSMVGLRWESGRVQ